MAAAAMFGFTAFTIIAYLGFRRSDRI